MTTMTTRVASWMSRLVRRLSLVRAQMVRRAHAACAPTVHTPALRLSALARVETLVAEHFELLRGSCDDLRISRVFMDGSYVITARVPLAGSERSSACLTFRIRSTAGDQLEIIGHDALGERLGTSSRCCVASTSDGMTTIGLFIQRVCERFVRRSEQASGFALEPRTA